MPQDSRLLVKLRNANALRLGESRVNLRPLYETVPARLGIGAEEQWFLAELPDGAETPWDLAHARVAAQLGVDESDVIFAEPDLLNRDLLPDENADDARQRLGAVGENCGPIGQDGDNGNATGPGVGWHLRDDFTQLASARAAVAFSDPRTRIGHLDTGYYAAHVTLPKGIRHDLERNFVEGDHNPGSAEDPDNKLLVLDNSGHGTGTIGILAGGKAPELGDLVIGGAPDADVVPLRIADSVVLLRTSAFARALSYAVDSGCDVITMSMGGLPSEAWREAIDRAYLAGVVIVTAAGNNFRGLPTRHIVYPARYSRVIAACGVMADGRPYAHLLNGTMEGNFGPKKIMAHALGAYTPNIPWAVFGCATSVRLNGGGTSSATPQIAAAAALWLEKYKRDLPRDWRRVEAVRNALFTTARGAHPEELGRGTLQARAALDVRPALNLPQSKSDGDSFAFLRVITGLGIVEASSRERMFNLEIAQRWLLNQELQRIAPDPDEAPLDAQHLTAFMDALIGDEGASLALRRHVASRYPVIVGKDPAPTPQTKAVVPEAQPVCAALPSLTDPPYRRLRVYAVDPSASSRLATAAVSEATLNVRWEPLEKAGRGEYLAIDDVDASDAHYEAVDLNDPRLLAQDGWKPSDGNLHFHQQMVYAVAMKTIENFERALGRPVLWKHGNDPKNEYNDELFVGQLTLRPHALRQANAFYSPQEIALQFGYFEAAADDPGDHVPGSRIYSCLSHDIIAHETTHAVLDGMHSRFNEPTNPDVLAFHEAFADIVALMQHFTIPELLEGEIRRTRGNIEAESMLGSLAVQFGRATGVRGALRDAIGTLVNGTWKRLAADPADLQKRLTPHGRGAILVAAVFDAFIAIYNGRIADLLRINTGGTGELPKGAIHPDLVHRLSDEATKAAGHVLNICIRALDYLPPVDVTFFEYLRALITADFDLVTDDRYNYRVAFVEAFRRRGIYPVNLDAATPATLRTLSVDTLRWRGVDLSELQPRVRDAVWKEYRGVVKRLKQYADRCLYLKDRATLFKLTRIERGRLHADLTTTFKSLPEFAMALRLDPAQGFEVHQLRPAMRARPDGRHVPQVVVALTQSRRLDDRSLGAAGNWFRSGSTLLIDLLVPEIKYSIYKNSSPERQERTAQFLADTAGDPLRALFLGPERREPFAALHALSEGVQ